MSTDESAALAPEVKEASAWRRFLAWIVAFEEATDTSYDDIQDRRIRALEREVALFVRFWLTSTPPLPNSALAAAQATGRERYNGFIEALGWRLAKGKALSDEVSRKVQVHDGGDA